MYNDVTCWLGSNSCNLKLIKKERQVVKCRCICWIYTYLKIFYGWRWLSRRQQLTKAPNPGPFEPIQW